MANDSEQSQLSLHLEGLRTKLTPEEERRMIFARTEENVQKQGSDISLDKRSEKKFITEYRRYNPSKKYVQDDNRIYRPTVPAEFYEGICKLKGWSLDRAKRRSPIFAVYTVDLLYMRFPKQVIHELRKRNPYHSGFRSFKHFQFLTDLGYSDFQAFIKECTDLMEKCSFWSQFVRQYSQKHGLPYQVDLFVA